jgi:cell division protein FtsW (lipid II flippase)
MQMIDIRWDRILVILTVIMGAVGVGLVALATAREPWTFSDYAERQAIFFAIGVIVIWLVSRIDYRFVCRYSWWLYGGTLLLLLVVLVLGRVIGGSQRWLEFGPIRIQPSEFAKLALVFTLADTVLRVRHTLNWIWASLAGLVIVIPPMLLILIQPDLGTALVFLAIWFGLLFFGGISLRVLLGYVIFGALMIPAAMPFLKPYQRARLTAFLNPESDPLGACGDRGQGAASGNYLAAEAYGLHRMVAEPLGSLGPFRFSDCRRKKARRTSSGRLVRGLPRQGDVGRLRPDRHLRNRSSGGICADGLGRVQFRGENPE